MALYSTVLLHSGREGERRGGREGRREGGRERGRK